MRELWPWLALAGLGAYHGINPAMGWLFAVALGLQERSRAAVVRALLPIALGHEASIALTVLLVGGAQLLAGPEVLRLAGAALLVLFGLYKFARPRSHPRWVGMRVSGRELALWSLLMSTAHGAGLMLFPILLGMPSHEHGELPGHHASVGFEFSTASPLYAVGAAMLHTLVMLAVMAVVAIIVYEWLGLAVLRKAWVNLDVLWAAAFVVAGVATLFI